MRLRSLELNEWPGARFLGLRSGAGRHRQRGVTLSDFKLSPGTLSAKAGAVEFDVKNDGPTPHNLTVKDSTGKVVGATRNLSPGENAKLTITLTVGSYSVVCSLPGHESLGMKDALTVS